MPPGETPRRMAWRHQDVARLAEDSNKKRTAARGHGGSGRCDVISGSVDLQVLGRLAAAVGHDLVRDDLALIERAQTGALHGGDVDEDVLAAALGLDESIALGRVEPLHGTFSHQ